jgi:hypothetical protein
VRCPRCGGTARTAITPGTWRCATVVPTGTATPRSPATTPVAATSKDPEACGFHYAAGPPAEGTPQCRCGRFAIGRCTQCQAAVCGIHSGDLTRSLFCEQHYTAAIAALSTSMIAAQQQRLEAERQHERNVTAALAVELTTLDSVEACLRAARVHRAVPWDDAAVAAWYTERAATVEVPTRRLLIGTGGEHPWEEIGAAHHFPGGSTLMLSPPSRWSTRPSGHDYIGGVSRYAPAAVAPDGRILHSVAGAGWSWEPPQVTFLHGEVPRFSVRVLVMMAQRLRLPPLQSVPTPPERV